MIGEKSIDVFFFSYSQGFFSFLFTELMLAWMQMILILTKSVNRYYKKNPMFDMTPLLGGTDAVFLISNSCLQLVCSCSSCLFYFKYKPKFTESLICSSILRSLSLSGVEHVDSVFRASEEKTLGSD